MDLKLFKTDPSLDGGVWITLDDAQIKIARIGSPRYQSAMAARMKPHRNAIELGVMSNAQADKIMLELIADFILLDWSGVELDGEPLPYTRENVIRALSIPVFKNLVIEQAGDLENFRVKEVKQAVDAVAKN